jgi:hypothetical protein
MVVADAYFQTSEDKSAEIMAFQVPGVDAEALAEGIIPVLTTGYRDRRRSDLEVLGRPIVVVSDGEPDMEFGWLLAVHADNDVVWVIWGSGSDLIQVTEAVITASSAPRLRPPSAEPVAVGPTASEMILADVAAGAIDEATGLLNRVYAAANDPLLPDQYATYPSRDDDTAFDDATFRFASLASEIQEALAPYVVRPTDERSIYCGAEHQDASPAMAVLLADQSPCAGDAWTPQASSSISVVVWTRCDAASGTRVVDETLATLDGLYPKMVGLMGNPILDAGAPQVGGLVDRHLPRFEAGSVSRGPPTRHVHPERRSGSRAGRTAVRRRPGGHLQRLPGARPDARDRGRPGLRR